MKQCTVFFLMVLLTATCRPLKTSYDYDLMADFTKYHSFGFSPRASEYRSLINGDRLLTAIEIELRSRGFKKSEGPDVVIDVFVKLDEEETTVITSNGSSPWVSGYGVGFKVTEISTEHYQEGTVVISMLDEWQKKIVWQGRAQKILRKKGNADARKKRIDEAVAKIFKSYPFLYK